PSIADPQSEPQTSKAAKSQDETAQGKVDLKAATPVMQTTRPASNYVATAYSLSGKAASGRMVSRGLIAADPRVLPLGSRVRLEHPGYTGEYLVAYHGGHIHGHCTAA